MIARWCAAILVVGAMAATTAVKQKTFSSPEEAGQALVKAAEAFDAPALQEVFGPDGVDLVVTGDAVQDKNQSLAFAAQAHEKLAIVRDPANPRKAILTVGSEDWPSPIPIVQGKSGAWSFDTKAGRREILLRRIGRNELDAIELCRGYVEAQHEYALTRHAGSEVNQYAQRIIALPGKQDGLVWKNAAGVWEGPVAESIAKVIEEGYSSRNEPYHGYYFKVLKGQGPSAPLGTLDYVIKGVMIGGFALAAAPSDYEVTGIKSFIISQDGVVYQRDLGKGTADWIKSVERFDPDKKWDPVEDDDEGEDD
jgi:hypothetical protein